MPRLVKSFSGEKYPKDELGLQVRDPLIADDEINCTADVFAPSREISRAVGAANAG